MYQPVQGNLHASHAHPLTVTPFDQWPPLYDAVELLWAHTYIIALLSLCHLPDPIAFCDIVGKEEDAEKEEDMKNSKQNEEEARAVVSAQVPNPPTPYFLYDYVLMID